MRRVLLIGALILGGCSTVQPITAPDGKQAYRVKCSGTGRSWGDCVQKAGETCGSRGYDVLARNEEHPQASVVRVNDDEKIGDVVGSNTVARDLIIRCKGD